METGVGLVAAVIAIGRRRIGAVRFFSGPELPLDSESRPRPGGSPFLFSSLEESGCWGLS